MVVVAVHLQEEREALEPVIGKAVLALLVH